MCVYFQYKEGGRYLKQALDSELLAKKTVRATETQSLVHFVASLYAWLPSWVTEPVYRPTKPCFSLAMLACRQAMAVLNAFAPTSYGMYLSNFYCSILKVLDQWSPTFSILWLLTIV